MRIAGQISRRMLSRYSQIRMRAMRQALETVEKRRAEHASQPCGGDTLAAGAAGSRVVN
jgi:hypothetical protein